MKLVYISPLRYPSERAGSLFSVKSCEAFAAEGVSTELWIPRRRNNVFEKDVFDHYGVKRNFTIRKFFAIDLIQFGTWAYILLYVSFALSVSVYVLWKKVFGKLSEYVFYSHEQFVLFVLTFLSKKTFYEVHDFPGQQKMYNVLFSRIRGVVTTNTWKAKKLSERFHLSKNEVCTVFNAVDIDDFSSPLSTDEARKKLGLESHGFLIGYIGGLLTKGMDKGVGTAIDSLAFLPHSYKLFVVGGEAPQDIELYKTYAIEKGLQERVVFVGPVSHTDVSLYSSACDCLVAPFPRNDHYSYYMSPMKIFEYMASQRPMIVTDLPSLREIVKDSVTGIIVQPSDPKGLAMAVERVTTDKELADTLANDAYTEVSEKYTWHKRAQKILAFLKQ